MIVKTSFKKVWNQYIISTVMSCVINKHVEGLVTCSLAVLLVQVFGQKKKYDINVNSSKVKHLSLACFVSNSVDKLTNRQI